jgi:hypothetical protein
LIKICILFSVCRGNSRSIYIYHVIDNDIRKYDLRWINSFLHISSKQKSYTLPATNRIRTCVQS